MTTALKPLQLLQSPSQRPSRSWRTRAPFLPFSVGPIHTPLGRETSTHQPLRSIKSRSVCFACVCVDRTCSAHQALLALLLLCVKELHRHVAHHFELYIPKHHTNQYRMHYHRSTHTQQSSTHARATGSSFARATASRTRSSHAMVRLILSPRCTFANGSTM